MIDTAFLGIDLRSAGLIVSGCVTSPATTRAFVAVVVWPAARTGLPVSTAELSSRTATTARITVFMPGLYLCPLGGLHESVSDSGQDRLESVCQKTHS